MHYKQCFYLGSNRSIHTLYMYRTNNSLLLRRFFGSCTIHRSPQKAISPATEQSATSQHNPPVAHLEEASQRPPETQDYAKPVVNDLGDLKIESRNGSYHQITSSVPAGTPLKGLNYFKSKEDPIALENSEYPRWLWTLLGAKDGPVEGQKEEVDPRLYSKSARARQIANKRARKIARMNSNTDIERVPLYEQSINLATGRDGAATALEVVEARDELTSAMRAKRRNQIKEANFLKEMG